MNLTLTNEQIAKYRADGYLIVPNVLSEEEVRIFLEGESKPKPPEMRKGLRSHTVDPQWNNLATHPNVAGITRQLLDGLPMIVQTMYLNKPANGGRGIALHQDTHYLPSEPNTLMACWIAMDDTDAGNGGLCVVPGSHHGGLRTTQIAQNEGEHVRWEYTYRMRDRSGKEWEQPMYSFEISDLKPDEIVRLTVPRGAGVFFTGMTIHGSFANESETRSRRAFAVHYIREDSWLFRMDVQEVVPAIS